MSNLLLSLFQDLAVVYRLSYSGNNSTIAATGNSYKGYLKPISPQSGLIGLEKVGKTFTFTTHLSYDIKESDELDIDGTRYKVSAIANKKVKQLQIKECILNRK